MLEQGLFRFITLFVHSFPETIVRFANVVFATFRTFNIADNVTLLLFRYFIHDTTEIWNFTRRIENSYIQLGRNILFSFRIFDKFVPFCTHIWDFHREIFVILIQRWRFPVRFDIYLLIYSLRISEIRSQTIISLDGIFVLI